MSAPTASHGRPSRPTWRSWPVVGGAGLVLGSALELVEVLIFSWTDSRGVTEDWFLLNGVLLVAAGLVVAAAAASLALGVPRGPGSGSLVGGSSLGTVALLVFAVAQLAAKVVTALYFTIPDGSGGAALAVSGAAVAVAFVAVIAAAVVVARAGVAHGVARWSLFAVVAVGPLTALAVTLSSTLELAANVLAVLVQALVGLTYLRLTAHPIEEDPHAPEDHAPDRDDASPWTA